MQLVKRWASTLGQYNFEIIYRSGLTNIDADSMSRYPYHKVGRNQTESNMRIYIF